MVKVTNSEILASVEPLAILSAMELPVLVSLQIFQLMSKLYEPTLVTTNAFNKLVTTYGERQPSGETVVVGPNDFLKRPVSPNWEKFSAEQMILLAQTVELDIKKVQLPTEIDGKPLRIAPKILMGLAKFVGVDGIGEQNGNT